MPGADPYRAIALVLRRHSAGAGRRLAGLLPVLGTITTTGLQVDGYKHELQRYLIAEHLMVPASMGTTGTAGDPAHTHSMPTPARLRALAPGDRVIVTPVNGGRDHVVIGRVVANA